MIILILISFDLLLCYIICMKDIKYLFLRKYIYLRLIRNNVLHVNLLTNFIRVR